MKANKRVAIQYFPFATCCSNDGLAVAQSNDRPYAETCITASFRGGHWNAHSRPSGKQNQSSKHRKLESLFEISRLRLVCVLKLLAVLMSGNSVNATHS